MKIGILTLQSGANYGGTLQCYALSETLKSFGHEAFVINFKPNKIAPFWKGLLLAVTCCRSILDIKALISRATANKADTPTIDKNLEHIFDAFRSENMCLTEQVNEITIKNIVNSFDAIVIGSDQVWGSFVRDELTYFGDFGCDYTGKLVSYAACAPNIKYPIIRRNKLSKLFKRFQCISVRDSVTAKLVKNISNLDVPVVLDPTIIYSFSKREEFKSPLSQPYILFYTLGKDISGGNIQAASILRRKFEGKVQIIAVNIYGESLKFADKTLNDVEPFQWIGLLANASLVFTDSFHASVFATKYRVPVIAYYSEENRASRLIDFFKCTGLYDYLVSDTEMLETALASIKRQYESYISPNLHNSIQYLKEALT